MRLERVFDAIGVPGHHGCAGRGIYPLLGFAHSLLLLTPQSVCYDDAYDNGMTWVRYVGEGRRGDQQFRGRNRTLQTCVAKGVADRRAARVAELYCKVGRAQWERAGAFVLAGAVATHRGGRRVCEFTLIRIDGIPPPLSRWLTKTLRRPRCRRLRIKKN